MNIQQYQTTEAACRKSVGKLMKIIKKHNVGRSSFSLKIANIVQERKKRDCIRQETVEAPGRKEGI